MLHIEDLFCLTQVTQCCYGNDI